jgi:hypothetical protein
MSFSPSRQPRFKQFPTVLAICEDSKSGLKYLNDASFHFRASLKIEVSHCGKTDPKGIVKEALKHQKKFDHVYCVIDRDAHPNFHEAIALAKTSNKVSIIASYPCFEFWLFGYCYTSVSAGNLTPRLARTQLRICSSGICANTQA